MRNWLLLLNAAVITCCLIASNNASAQATLGQYTTKPVIDGTVGDDEWSGQPAYLIVDPTTWTPNADLTSFDDFMVSWRAVWDQDSLYYLFEVTDDIVTVGDTATEGSSAINWMNDAVELYLSDQEQGSTTSFRFSYGRDNDTLVAASVKEGFVFRTNEVESGYVIEASIAWSILSDSLDISTPAIGDAFTSSIQGVDLDDPDASAWDALSGHLHWPKGNSHGSVVLEETAPIDNDPPAVPSGTSVSDITYNTATIRWDEMEDVSFVVFDGDKPFARVDTNYYEAKLSPETDYAFNVRSFDLQNLSEASESVTFTTEEKPEPKVIEIAQYQGSRPDDPFQDFDTWEAATRHAINRKRGSGSIDGPSDLSAEFSAMWDENNLYVVTYVQDDFIYSEGELGYHNDNIEYLFDMRNQRDGTSAEDVDGDKYQPDNFQIRFVAKVPEMQTGSTPAPDWTGITQVNWDLFAEDGQTVIGWYIEGTFPWSTLNANDPNFDFTPQVDDTLGFDVKVADIDPEQNAISVMWSTLEYGPNRNNSQYGQLVLKEQAASPCELDPSLPECNVTGIAEEELIHYMGPNPVADMVTIVTKEWATIRIFDLEGRLVANTNGAGPTKVSVGHLKKGVYLVKVLSKDESSAFVSKLIVK